MVVFEKWEKTESTGLLTTDALRSVKQKGGWLLCICMSMHERNKGGERDGQLSLYQLSFFPMDLLECSFLHKERDSFGEQTHNLCIFLIIPRKWNKTINDAQWYTVFWVLSSVYCESLICKWLSEARKAHSI